MLSHLSICILSLILNAESNELEIECHYKYTRAENYICQVQKMNETAGYETIKKANGSHNLGKTNNDVTIVEGFYLDVTYLPLGFGTVFRALYALQIMRSNLTHIKKENFADMKNLKLLTLSTNLIETLSDDVFSELPELEFLILAGNRIKVLPDKIFEFNKNLKDIYLSDAKLESIQVDLTKLPCFSSIELRRNVCIDAVYRLPNYREGLTTLEGFQKTIKEKCP